MTPVSRHQPANERRQVRRPFYGPSTEYSGRIHWGRRAVPCDLDDLHFAGARITISGSETDLCESPDALEIIYGTTPISRQPRPEVVWRNGRSLGLKFQSALRSDDEQRKEVRWSTKPDFVPAVLAKDPIKLDLFVHFRVLNLSTTGLLLETSVSNRHILKDLRFLSATLLLPGTATLNITFVVRHIELVGNTIRAGVQFEDLDRASQAALAQFSAFGVVHAEHSGHNAATRALSSVRKVGSAVRIEILSSTSDYEEILRVRLAAYREAGIITAEVTTDDMADEYDSRSIIMVAKIDNFVVGTGRLIRCTSPTHQFMFEKDIPFSAFEDRKSRCDYVECSRLAIDPAMQGTDLLGGILKEGIRLMIMNRMAGLCLARTTQRQSYAKFGWRTVSHEIPHPLLADQTLALMSWDAADFLNGTSVSPVVQRLIVPDISEKISLAGFNLLQPTTPPAD